MRFTCVLVLVLVACTNANEDEDEEMKILDEFLEKTGRKCSKLHDGSKDEQEIGKAIKEHGIKGAMPVMNNVSKEMKCFSDCFLSELNIWNPDKTVNRTSRFVKGIKHMYEKEGRRYKKEDLVERVEKDMEPCLSNSYADQQGECEAAWALVKCVFEKMGPVVETLEEFRKRGTEEEST